jgi:hypothetical protein
MFDNLPFYPALRVLSEIQADWSRQQRKGGSNFDSATQLRRRCNSPDLFIAGSLDVSPSELDVEFEDLIQIRERAAAIQKNVKIQNFQEASTIVSKQARSLASLYDQGRPVQDHDFVDQLVVPAVLPIYPTNSEHLNGTFNFCASLGLTQERVSRSIADGCFQTLLSINKAQQRNSGNEFTDTSVARLTERKRIPNIGLTQMSARPTDGSCPYFQFSDKATPSSSRTVTCPFHTAGKDADADGIYTACVNDHDHQQSERQPDNISSQLLSSHMKEIIAHVFKE